MDKKKETDEQSESLEEEVVFSLNDHLDEIRPLPEYYDMKPGRFFKEDDVDIVVSAGLDVYKLIFTREKPDYNIFFKAIKNF